MKRFIFVIIIIISAAVLYLVYSISNMFEFDVLQIDAVAAMEEYEEEVIIENIIAATPIIAAPESTIKPIEEPWQIKNAEIENKTQNILCLGIDSRNDDFKGLSDVMVLVTLDGEKKEIKLTSFMRDMLVEVPGKGKQKLNTAYLLGGAELTCETIEKNFDVEIDGWAVTNFSGMASIIDAIGGLDVDLSSAEVVVINKILKGESIEKEGLNHLDGSQTLAYVRDRTNGGDSQRTARQREVISLIIENINSLDFFEYIKLINTSMNNISLGIEKALIDDYIKLVWNIKGKDIESLRVPDKYKGGRYKGMWIAEFDLYANRKLIDDFLYGE